MTLEQVALKANSIYKESMGRETVKEALAMIFIKSFNELLEAHTIIKYLLEKSLQRFQDNTADIEDVLAVYSFFKEIWEQPMIHIEVAEELEELVELIQPKMKDILDEWLKDVKRQIKDIKEQE